jgi:hypothetical protein
MNTKSSARLAVLSCIPLVWAAHAWAGPAYCTGTTMTVASGASVAGSFLLTGGASSGNCVEAGDKVFGAFAVSGALSGAGSSVFDFAMTPGDVSLGFQGSVAASMSGTLSYIVAVDPTKAGSFLIDNLEKDFTLNSNPAGTSASATLTGSGTPLTGTAISFDCMRTVNPSSSTCPETEFLSSLTMQLAVVETIATGANAVVTGLTDTVSQRAIPEPSSLLLLLSALAGFAWIKRRTI